MIGKERVLKILKKNQGNVFGLPISIAEIEKIPKEKILKKCNGCDFLNIEEYEQDLIKAKTGEVVPHICLKFNKQILHFPYVEPYLTPCEECLKGGAGDG